MLTLMGIVARATRVVCVVLDEFDRVTYRRCEAIRKWSRW